MLPGGTDAAYRELLAGPHHPYTRIEVWAQGVRIDTYGDDGLPISQGDINATLASQVTRQVSLTTIEDLYPQDETDLLAPFGNELRIFQGVKPGSGVPYEWQTFRGRIQEAQLGDDGGCEIRASDRAQDIKDSGFLNPENTHDGNPISAEFRRLVLDALPDATFGTFSTILNTTPILTFESDRGDACDQLLKGSNAFWYALANGDFVIRLIPWTQAATPVIDLHDEAGGTLTGATPSTSRDNVYNQVVVVGERADGTPPVFGVSSDLTLTSPTYVGGKFGVKTLFINPQSAANQAQAKSLSRSALRSAKSFTQTWSLSGINDPSLELGDCIGITARGLPRDIQVVSSYSLDLMYQADMSISTQALRPGTTSEEI